MKAPVYSEPCTSPLRRMADLSPSCQAHHAEHVRHPTASPAAAQGCVSSCCSAARAPLTFQAGVPPCSTADPANRTLLNPPVPSCHCHLDSRFRRLVNNPNPDSLVYIRNKHSQRPQGLWFRSIILSEQVHLKIKMFQSYSSCCS